MKAIRLLRPGDPLAVQDMPVPEPSPGEALVRVRAAGICHSDAHYRAGRSRTRLPLTLGHEVAGVIEAVGAQVPDLKPGDRVCLHYLKTCGVCSWCQRGNEQFCLSVAMIGKDCDGGYAEFIAVPRRSVFRLPEEIPFEQGAIMMCSSATALHALNQAKLRPGDSVAVFGVGGLGASALQLARIFGAGPVFAVDIAPSKLELARALGAEPVDAAQADPVSQIRDRTGGRGVDVALELIGLPQTMERAVRALAIKGRAAIAGITGKRFEIAPYQDVLNKETEIVGVSDHLASELPLLIEWVRQGRLDLSRIVTRRVPLEAAPINAALDELERFGSEVRTVIKP